MVYSYEIRFLCYYWIWPGTFIEKYFFIYYESLDTCALHMHFTIGKRKLITLVF